jgi:hypothetical protein
MLNMLFGVLFFAWAILSLVWLSTFAQRGRTPWAKLGFRYRRVRWTVGIAAASSFVLAGVVAQGLAPSADLKAGGNPAPVSIPSDAPPTDFASASANSKLSDSEQQYVSSIQSQATELGASMGRFHDLATRPDVFNDNWKLQLAKELALWQIEYTNAQKLQPSARFTAVQVCWVGALRDLNNAANEIASGLDHSDVEEINVANAAILRSNDTIEGCAAQMTALSASVASK